jgi:OOP family OmpA-OmpF porin
VVTDEQAELAREREPATEGDTELETVARILLGMSRDQLLELYRKHDSPESFVEYLARSIAATSKNDAGGSFASAMAPIVSRGVLTTVERDPETFGRAIAPVMGPALREAVRQSLTEFVRNTEQLLNDSLSVRGLRWRLEALRTGRSFASVALMHSLIYRVEDIYLVHRESGLLLHHESLDRAAETREPELVSAMLTAIRSFAADAFEAREEDGLEAFQVGDLSVVVEGSQDLTLAAVVRGRVPGFLRESLEDSVQHFQRQFSHELQEFDGETDPFAAASERMRRSLAAKLKEASEAVPRRGRFVMVAAAVLLLGLIAAWQWTRFQSRRADDRLIAALAETPGVVVTEVARRGSALTIAGLRDPAARDPNQILSEVGAGSPTVLFRFDGYSSHHPDLILARIRSRLAPPPGIELQLDADNALAVVAEGMVSAETREWLRRAEQLWPSIPGLTGFRVDEQPLPTPRGEVVDVAFALGSSALESLSLPALEHLRQVLKQSEELGSRRTVAVWGYDGGEPSAIDSRLLEQRLQTIREALAEDAAVLETLQIGGIVEGSLECDQPCDLVAGLRFSVQFD